MSTWDATTLDRSIQGEAPPVAASTTAAAVSSQDVSMPRMRIGLRDVAQRFREGRMDDAAIGDDGRDEAVRRDVESGVANRGAGGRNLGRPDVRDFLRVALL